MEKRVVLLACCLLFLSACASSRSSLPDTMDSSATRASNPTSVPIPSSPLVEITPPSSTTTTLAGAPTTLPPATANSAVTTSGTAPEGTLPWDMPGEDATTTTLCGNDYNVCYVEFDITGDQKFECCNAGSNPSCEMCFEPCSGVCIERNKTVKFCFGTNITFTCECTDEHVPTCYSTTTSSTTVVSTTYAGFVDATRADKPLYYFLLLVFLFVVLAALIYYVRGV